MVTWEQFASPRPEPPSMLLGNVSARLRYEDDDNLVLQVRDGSETDGAVVRLSRQQAVALRDFLGALLPTTTPEGASIISEQTAEQVEVGAGKRFASIGGAEQAAASQATAKAMVEDLQQKELAADGGEPGDEEVPEPPDEPADPTAQVPAADRGTASLIAQIWKLLGDFGEADANSWSLTDPVFINHKTTELEVLSKKVADKEVLRAIRDELEAIWRKRSQKFPNPLKDKPATKRRR